MLFSVSKYYEIVTEESARDGDADERGEVFADRELTARETIRELRECSELSCYPTTPSTAARVWATTEAQQDYQTGAYESFSVHVRRADGAELSSRQMFRLLRAARLVKGAL